jgi:hypothetical protein
MPFQTLISRQGDTDAGATVMGMLVGGALAELESQRHLRSPFWGKIAVLAGFVSLFIIVLLYRERIKSCA